MRYYYYIQEVIDNYYNISLEERLKLIEMIKKLHSTHTYDIGRSYHDILDTIELLTKKAYQVEQLEEFYNSLTKEQQKELRTQTHIKAKSYYKGNWYYDVPKSYELVKELLTLDKPERIDKREKTFKVDFDRLEEEFGGKGTDYYACDFSVSGFFKAFTRSLFYHPLGITGKHKLSEEEKKEVYRKYTKPMLDEYYYAEQRYSDIIESEFSESTKKLYDSLDDAAKMYTRFDMLDVTAEDLDWKTECREYENVRNKEQQEEYEKAKNKTKKKTSRYKNNSRRGYRR